LAVVAVGVSGQLKFSGADPIVVGVAKLAPLAESCTVVASSSLIAPYAPLRGTDKGEGEPLLTMLRVSVTREAELVVKVTAIWHVAPALNVLFRQESPTIANAGPVTLSLVNVTDSLPAMETVTVSTELTAGDVPEGIPKEREVGDAETACASELWGARPSTKRTRITEAITRKFVSSEAMAAGTNAGTRGVFM